MLDLNGYTGAAGGSLKPSIEAVISHSIDVLDHELYGINQKVWWILPRSAFRRRGQTGAGADLSVGPR